MNRYNSIGFSIFIIILGLTYLLPAYFPEGTMYIVAGVIIFILSLISFNKSEQKPWFELVIAIALALNGINKVAGLDLGFFPIAAVVLGVIALITALLKKPNH